MKSSRSGQSFVTQIQSEWELRRYFWRRNRDFSSRMFCRGKSCETATFRFVAVYRKGGIIQPSGVSDVVSAAFQTALVPGIDDFESEWGVYRNSWVETARRLPCTKPYPC